MSVPVRHTLIKASAGSGKTFQLSTRFLALLALDEAPEKILATTFTRKAAGEIMTRVFQRLAQGAASPRGAARLEGELDAGTLTQARCGELLSRLIRAQHKLNVCTMDSFCVKVARAFALELGFSSAWEIVDADQDARVRELALQEMLSTLDSGDLAALTRLAHGDAADRSVFTKLLSQLGAAYELFLFSQPDAWGAFKVPRDVEEKELAKARTALPNHRLAVTKAGESDKRWLKARATAVAILAQDDWGGILKTGITAKVALGETIFGGSEIPAEVCALYGVIAAHARAVLLARAKAATEALYALLEHFDRSYRELKNVHAALRFVDVKRALSSAAVFQDLSSLYFRLDARIHHLLLDEFQDTSREEWNVMLPLAEEILSQGEDRRTFFCVGDMKQAIYGWRGGVAEIFDAVERRFAGSLQPDALNESRRSAPEIIAAVNRVFGALQSNSALEEYPAAAALWQERFARHETHLSGRRGFVELRVAAPGDADEEPEAALYRELCALVGDLQKRAPHAEIGVLVRRNKIAARIRYELQKPPSSVFAREEGGSPVTDSPAVTLVLSLLTMCDHPGDTAARFHVASSPLGGELQFSTYADDRRAEELARYVRGRLQSDGYGLTLRWLSEKLAPYCDARDQGRLLQLGELALMYEPRATLRAMDFVRFVEGARRESAGDARVRVMTIHQAKGLEFDVVILPELETRLAGDVRSTPLLYRRASALEPVDTVLCAPPAAVVEMDPQLKAMRAQMDTALVSESLSVLYVALTRAKFALYMLALPDLKKEPKPEATFAGLLQAACASEAGAAPGAVLYRAGAAEWTRDFEREFAEKPALAPTQLRVKLKPLAPVRSRIIARRSPSGLEGGRECDVALLLHPEGAQARVRGTLLHRFFEQVSWLEEGAPDAQALLAVADREGVDRRTAQQLIDLFLSSIAQPALDAALRQARYGGWGELELWRERAFALRQGDHLLSGAFDRVVIGRRGEEVCGAEILDFKSDVAPVAELAEKVEYYRPQIEAYRGALAQMLGIAAEKIKGALLFVQCGEVREV